MSVEKIDILEKDSYDLFKMNYEERGLQVFLNQVLLDYDGILYTEEEVLFIFNDLLTKKIQKMYFENYLVLSYIKTVNELLSYEKIDITKKQMFFKKENQKDIEIKKTKTMLILPVIGYTKINICDIQKNITEKNKNVINKIVSIITENQKIFNDFINKANNNKKDYFFFDVVNNNLIFYNKEICNEQN